MRGSAYLDYTDETRMQFFSAHDFPMTKWQAHGGSPIVLEQQIKYFKEIRFQEKFKVNYRLLKISEDQRFFHQQHQFLKENGKVAAEVKVMGAFMNIKARKIVVPPEELLLVLEKAKQ